MIELARALAAVSLVAAFALLSAWCAAAVAPDARRGRFVAAWALSALWLQVVLFEALLVARLFYAAVAVPLVVIAALALEHRHPRARLALRRALRAMRAAWRLTCRRRGYLLAAAFPLVHAVALLARSTLSPPLGWDSLTYHLWRATRWVQCGRDCLEDGPSAWHYYNYYPYSSDAPWAWALLPLRSDTLVGAIAVAGTTLLLFGVYRLARALDAPRGASLLSGLALVALPACLQRTGSVYVDHLALAPWCLGLAAVIDAHRRPLGGDLVVGVAGLGLAAAFKPTGLACLVLALPLIAFVARGHTWRQRGLCIAVLLLVLASYGRNALATGNPVYPFALSIGPWTLREGHREMNALFSLTTEMRRLIYEADPSMHTPPSIVDVATRLFAAPTLRATWRDGQQLGLGALVLLAGGAAAAVALARRKAPEVLTLTATAAVVVVTYLSPAMAMQRWQWLSSSSRLLLHVPVAATVLVAAALGRRAWWLFAPSLVVSLAAWRPYGLLHLDLRATALGALAVAVAIGSVLAARRRPWALLVAVTALGLATRARTTWRARYYDELAHGRASDNGLPLAAAARPMPEVWNALATRPARRLAFVPSWKPSQQQRWFLYPLTGAWLQHELRYVAPSADGTMVDFYDYMVRADDYTFARDAWLRRLCTLRIDGVVAMGPVGQSHYLPDMGWIARDPERFVVEFTARRSTATVYRFRPRASDCEGAREGRPVLGE